MSAGGFYRASVRRGAGLPPVWVQRARAAEPVWIGVDGGAEDAVAQWFSFSGQSGPESDWPDAPTPYQPLAGGGSLFVQEIGPPELVNGGLVSAGIAGALPGADIDADTPAGDKTPDNGSGCEGLAAKDALCDGGDTSQRGLSEADHHPDASQCHTECPAKACDEAPPTALAVVERVSRPARAVPRAGAADPKGLGEVRKAPPKVDWAKVAAVRRGGAPVQVERRPFAFLPDEELAAVPTRTPRPATVRPSVARAAPPVTFRGKQFCSQCDHSVTEGDVSRCRDRFCRFGGK